MGDSKTVASARQRVHQAVRDDIVEVARRQLAVEGAGALSLRAVARELDMASSAMYRYFKSRDELFTALIVNSYDAMGELAERAAATPGSALGRFRAVCRAVRGWSVDHPHEYALLYGSPVPDYSAPSFTVEPASRVVLTLGSLIVDGISRGEVTVTAQPLPRSLAAQVKAVGQVALPGAPPWTVARATQAWALLFGQVSFEVFGRLTGIVDDLDALFEFTVSTMADIVGFSTAR